MINTRTNRLDPRLQADTHFLGTLPGCTVLQFRASSLPWLILVPDTDKTELFELPEAEQQRILRYSSDLSGFIKTTYSADKINVATIGNVVAQMHIHVIGRFHDDYCWPSVVWGRVEPDPGMPDPASTVTALAGWFGARFRSAP